MTTILPWLDYAWSFDSPAGMFAAVCERLCGTPARLEEMLEGIPSERLMSKPRGKWSALEHAGHLLVLDETLHHPRVEQYLKGEKLLLAADMSNRGTEEADFNALDLQEILKRFRQARLEMMRLLDRCSDEDAARVALHPRLQKSLRLVDLCYFMAEHDDHHLALIRRLTAAPVS